MKKKRETSMFKYELELMSEAEQVDEGIKKGTVARDSLTLFGSTLSRMDSCYILEVPTV